MTQKDAVHLAWEAGFAAVAPLDVDTLVPQPQVRHYCAEDKCAQYAKNWACPPHCGTLDACAAAIRQFRQGVLVQTAAPLENPGDRAEMERLSMLHAGRLAWLQEHWEGPALFLSGGPCRICKQCTCPDSPCRFPERRMSSMEAFGLMVAPICAASGMDYAYGTDPMRFVSCVLF